MIYDINIILKLVRTVIILPLTGSSLRPPKDIFVLSETTDTVTFKSEENALELGVFPLGLIGVVFAAFRSK